MKKDFKYITVKPLGWKRVVRLFERFGWSLDDATEHTEITQTKEYNGEINDGKIHIKEEVSTSKYVRMNLRFFRDKDDFQNLNAVLPLEIIFKVVFFFRRISGTLAPLAAGLFVVMMFLTNGGNGMSGDPVARMCVADIILWAILRIFENIISFIASRILRRVSP